MKNPRDCWHEPYLNEDGSVNSNCRLFAGWSQEHIDIVLDKLQ